MAIWDRVPRAHTPHNGLHPGSCPTVVIVSIPVAPQVSEMHLQRNTETGRFRMGFFVYESTGFWSSTKGVVAGAGSA